MRKIKILKLSIFTAAVFGLGFFASSSEAQAATYYVSTTGSDTKNCTDATTNACATFNYAQTKMSAGDTLIAKAGTYNQTITVSKPNITIQGELDANGNRLSIIDPYTDVSGESWVEDLVTFPGGGVYKNTLSHRIDNMLVEIEGQRYKIFKLCHPDDEDSPPIPFCNDWATDLARTNDKNYLVAKDSPVEGYINFWDGYNAFFAVNALKETWVRFDDSSVVSAKTLLVPLQAPGATIDVDANNVTIKDLKIYADEEGVRIENGINYATIDSNEIYFGSTKIHAPGTSNNLTITKNIMSDKSYSRYYIRKYTRGAYQQYYSQHSTYANLINVHHYGLTKYKISHDNTKRSWGLYIDTTTNSNISNNNVTDVKQSLTIYTSGTNTVFDSNTITHSDLGFIPPTQSVNLKISNNYVENVIYFMRLDPWEGAETYEGSHIFNNNSVIYVYGNKVKQPLYTGGHFKFYYSTNGGVINKVGQLWVYHNSFSGGVDGANLSADSVRYEPQGMGGVHFINNIISTPKFYNDMAYLNPNFPVECSYNWISRLTDAGTYGCAMASGGAIENRYNGIGEPLMWDPSADHYFTIPTIGNGSDAIGTGYDITQSPYSSLPGFNPNYFFGTRPDMGAVQSCDITGNPTDVNGDGTVNIKDIQICIKGIVAPGSFTTSDQLNQLAKCKAVAPPSDVVNIKDIQAIVQEIVNPSQ